MAAAKMLLDLKRTESWEELMKYGLVVFRNSVNLGDDIQTYAAEQYLPHTDYIIDRENMDAFYTETGERIAVIMGGWFLYNHLNWPPSPFIKPLSVSMHFDTFYSRVAGEKLIRNFVLEDYGAAWLIENGPIGCRDQNTRKLLEKYGIPGYFSGCLTLTIKPFENIEHHGKICLVDIPEDVKNYIKEKVHQEVTELTHFVKMSTMEWKRRREIVSERLRVYQGASLVVTTRLHAALPCLALGVPVLLIKENWSLNRLGTWLEYVNYCSKEQLFSGEYAYDFDHPRENPQNYKELSVQLDNLCSDFIGKCEREREEKLDVEMFIDGSRRVKRLQKLMALRVDKYEKELYGH